MPVDYDELLNAVAVIADKNDLQVAVSQSVKIGIVTGITTCLGAFFLGSRGMGLGAAIGVATCAYMYNGTYKSLSELLKNGLTKDQREKLGKHITSSVKDFEALDVAKIALIIAKNLPLQISVMNCVISYVTNELGYTVNKEKID